MIIFEGKSRYQKVYSERSTTWEELIERLKNTKRTSETVSEYCKMTKDEQDSIKDVGAFVGGRLDGGSRKKIYKRQIIALDADYVKNTEEFIAKCDKCLNCAYAIYSTHKHTSEAPRFRLLIPTIEIDPVQYSAISRKVAEQIGIDYFDDTTYEPNRIMYWPSTSKDGEYIFTARTGVFLDADKVLKTYADYKDISTWPTSSRQKHKLRVAEDEAEDPTKKEGVVGQFCRAYTIKEAIAAFVPDYASGRDSDRYTYIKGSTSNGVVVYDDLWSFSHHDTDPASGRLCNAFDLVRLHKFGGLDKDKEYKTVTKMPSYKKMCEFAEQDSKVIAVRSAEFASDLDTVDTPAEDEDWTKKLQVTKAGIVKPNYYNICMILANHKQYKDRLAYDKFAERPTLDEQFIEDYHDAQMRAFFDMKYGIVGRDKIYDSVLITARKNTFHPVKNYLESLSWDGKERCKNVFIDYFACNESRCLDYTKAVSRKFFYSAVKRIYEPGCRIDEMLTLRGEQGCGKSTFFYRISKGFFTDSIKNIKSKDAMDLLRGVWICEFGELAALRKSDSEDIKGFLSSAVDRYREAYGRRTQDHKRSCIFVATTNELEFLRDPTGNRRYWVLNQVKGKKPKKDVFNMTDDYIDQLWAEAKYLYDNDLETEVLTGNIKKAAKEIQKNFRSEDPREDAVKEYLETLIPDGWYDLPIEARIDSYQQRDLRGVQKRKKVCAREIWQECFGNYHTKQFGRYEASEINKIIDSLPNWERVGALKIRGYGTAKGFRRKHQNEE